MPASLRSFTDAATDSLAREIAAFRREARAERDVRDAEYRARLAELDARLANVAQLERTLEDRLAALKDGEPGKDGTDGRDGTDGKDGTSVSVEDVEPLLKSEAERVSRETAETILAGWDRPQDERSVTVEELAPLVDEIVQRAVSALPAPKDGKDGRDGADGADGKDGERGADGAPGKLPTVREWEDRVYYESEVVTRSGSVYQAAKDTGRAPPHEDWTCIVSAGQDGKDGRSFTIRGTFKEGDEYQALDIVALNGASFAARLDDPGPCPGEGWQLIAMQGKQGKPGERGAPGRPGDRGAPGEPVVGASINNDGLLTLANGDGSTVDVDLYPMLSKAQQ